jgi:hypothetical protein
VRIPSCWRLEIAVSNRIHRHGSLSATPSPNWSLQSLPLDSSSRGSSPVLHRRPASHERAYRDPRGNSIRSLAWSAARDEVLDLTDDVSSNPSELDNSWKLHIEGEDLNTRCTWKIMVNGVEQECGFTSRKHATKRHIETTHLLIKRWECKLCSKEFTQKASLLRHHSLQSVLTILPALLYSQYVFTVPAPCHLNASLLVVIAYSMTAPEDTNT